MAVDAAGEEARLLRKELDAVLPRLATREVSRAAVREAKGSPLRTDHLGASTYRDKGWTLMAAGDRNGAIQVLRQALHLAPLDSDAEVMLGWALMLEERFDEALAAFSRVLLRCLLYTSDAADE